MSKDKIAGVKVPSFRAICLVFLSVLFSSSLYAKNANIENDAYAEENHLPSTISGIPIQDFLSSPSYLRVLRLKAIKHERMYGACHTPQFLRRLGTGRPQIFRSVPEYGAVPQWIEVIEIGGCEPAHQLHMLIAVVNDAPQFYPLLPGDGLSLLDFTIRNDVMKTLIDFEQDHAKAAGCKKPDNNIRFHGIRMLSYKREKDAIAWDEVWDVSNCKVKKSLTINFTSNPADGTQFTISQPKAKSDEVAVTKADQRVSVAR